MTDQKPQLPPIPKGSKFKHALSLGINIWDNLENYRKEYGDSFTLTLPGQGPMVWSGDPAVVKDVFSLKEDQYDPWQVQIPIDIGEENTVFSNFKKHRDSRKMLIPSLSTTRLQDRADVMQEIITEHINSWVPGETQFDMTRKVGDITLDIICYTVFNERSGERKDKYKEYILGWLLGATNDANFTIGSLMGARKYRAKLNAAYKKRAEQGKLGNMKKGFMPWKQPLDYKLHVTEMIKEDVAAVRTRMDESEQHMLSLLARATDEDGNLLDIEKVVSEIMGLMVAGHETSAATSVWMFIWLKKRPDVYEKLRAEVMDSVKEHGKFDPLIIAELPYLTACLNESQRLTPSAPATVRWLTQDTKLGPLYLPAGTCIAPCTFLTQRNEKVYGPDAGEYKPERWLDGRDKPAPWEFFPFGGGRRACAGMNQARQQMRLFLGEMARRVVYETEIDYQAMDGVPTPRLIGGQAEPKDGCLVTITKVLPETEGLPEEQLSKTA